MKRPALVLFTALASLLSTSCENAPLTEIVVAVESDLRPGVEIDAVTVEATGGQTASGMLAGDDAVPLPLSVGIVKRGGSLGPITIRVRATLAGSLVVSREVVTSFIEGRSLYLPIFLSRLCQGATCTSGETCRAGACVSSQIDPATLDDFPGQVDPFDGGVCVPDTELCNGRDDDCDSRVDEEFDLTSDMLHCGACNRACNRTNATTACQASECTVTGCVEGFGDCNADPLDGCEDDLTSAAHCGACGEACSFANATGACADGGCVLGECAAGFGDCDADPANGCEVALDTLTDCGGCGVPCSVPGATASCATGTCAIETCDAGLGDCNGDPADGCEQPLDTLAHCGGCDIACDVANGTEECSTGACLIVACDPLFDDCGGGAADGCETPLTTLTDCGTCGTACTIADGTGTCASGTCAVESCVANRGDCNDDPSDGCEHDTRSDVNNCGTCDNVCVAPTDRCMNGECR